MRKGKKRRRRRVDAMKRGIYLLPNLLTSLSLFFGFYSLISTINGEYYRGAVAILLASFFDILDGMVARATRTTSRFGLEYDSLSDLVAFGVAPGILAYLWALRPFGKWGWLASFLFVACAALRLARFNVQINTEEKKEYKGLPSPVAAGMIAITAIIFHYLHWEGDPARHLTFLIMTYALALLMVSTIPYSNIKDELGLIKRRPFSVLLLSIVGLVLVVAETEMLFFTTLIVYTASGPIEGLILYWRKKRKKSTQPEIKVIQEIKSIGQKSSERSEGEKQGGIF
jgi:CDP-diacylglycerol--serine O-phosphatidyltransferase